MGMRNTAGIAAGRAKHPDVYFSPSYLDLDDSMARDSMLPQEEHRTLCKFSMQVRGEMNCGLGLLEGKEASSPGRKRGSLFIHFHEVIVLCDHAASDSMLLSDE